ncbi:hypothetical protein JJ685_18745 [Ramlibacter monticola]|uniref:Uncharacterized protein n=1 Tax=Ramlibacter monticola TaxID=1926872 RepID=A0A936Z1F6_9BURK|nr:hypothetical protein [Ramlibacter monticola]MBL0393185.1 hypothetical protein [Ramlibacter monticola]
MSQNEQQDLTRDEEPSPSVTGQQPPQQQEAHAGQGSESIMKQLREWERRRAGNTIGKRRNGLV